MTENATVDLVPALHTAMPAAQELLRRVRRLWERVKSLSVDSLKQMPVFNNDFTADGLGSYLDRVDEFVRDPIRSRNRQTLGSCGVDAGLLPLDVLDDSDRVNETAILIDRLTRSEHPGVGVLTSRGLLVSWIMVGLDEVRNRIESLERARDAFVRIAAIPLPEALTTELLYLSASDLSSISAAEAAGNSARELAELGCDLEREAPSVALDNATAAGAHIAVLRELAGKVDLQALVKGKSAGEARSVCEKARAGAQAEYDKLATEWGSLVSAAAVLAIDVDSASRPRSIPTLRAEIKRLRKECEAKGGEEGLRVLEFLRGDGDFPGNLNAQQLQRALVALQPSLSAALKGKQNASG